MILWSWPTITHISVRLFPLLAAYHVNLINAQGIYPTIVILFTTFQHTISDSFSGFNNQATLPVIWFRSASGVIEETGEVYQLSSIPREVDPIEVLEVRPVAANIDETRTRPTKCGDIAGWQEPPRLLRHGIVRESAE